MKRLLVLVASLALALSAASTAAAASHVARNAFGLAAFGPSPACDPGEITLVSSPSIGAPNPTYPGDTIGSTGGSWTVCGGLQYSGFWKEWRRDGSPIPGYPAWVAGNPGSFTYVVQTADVGHVITSAVSPCNTTWGCYTPPAQSSNSVVPIPPPPPPPTPTEIYGDNGETRTGEWFGGTGGNAWTVHQYANRYVIWTAGRGTYVVGRSATGTYIPNYPNNYMGPGYIGQFSPREGPPNKLVVNDPLQPGTIGPRDGVHGGLGCFAVDLYRVGPGTVDLNCRLLSSNNSAGVYQVDNEVVSGDSLGVTVAMRTRYRDSAGPVFSVTYEHRFTAADVRMQSVWQSDVTDSNRYIKEPRIVAVFGTSDVPIYGDGLGIHGLTRPHPDPVHGLFCSQSSDDGTQGYGHGVWGLTPSLGRIEDQHHHWKVHDVVPWCSTITVGPGAVDPNRQYHRGGFSVDVVGVPHNFSVEDPGYNHDYDGVPQFPDALNFNGWRRNADLAAGIPGYDGACQTKDPREHCRMPIGETSSANAWELGRVPGQYGVFVAIEAWRASIGVDDYLGRARRLPTAGTYYSETFKF